MSKCIGGSCHGLTSPTEDRSVAMNVPVDLSVAMTFDPKNEPGPQTIKSYREIYTRRSVVSGGAIIYFYASEGWSTERALRFVLT